MIPYEAKQEITISFKKDFDTTPYLTGKYLYLAITKTYLSGPRLYSCGWWGQDLGYI